MGTSFRAALLATAMTLVTQAAATATPYYVNTGQSTANTQIDVAHSSTWLFTLGAGVSLDLGGGDFTLKRGKQTELPIMLSLYEGADATGLLLESVSVPASAVAQAYAPVHFGFEAPVALAGGDDGASYFLALTSETGNAGSRQYSIKGVQETTLSFPMLSNMVAQPAPADTQAVVPEPMTAGLLGAGLVGLGLAWRRRAKPIGG